MDFPGYTQRVCCGPGMFVFPATFESVCAHFDGFDVARDRGPLNGLKAWLVLRVRGGNNLHWSAIAKDVVQGRSVIGGNSCNPQEKECLQFLGELLRDFFDYRSKHGVAAIFVEYSKFCRRRKLTIR